MFESSIKGVVLETYGTGNVSVRKTEFISLVSSAIERGIVVVIGSQCQSGSVNLGAYETGKQLEKIGCLSALDMTTEATVTKLSYLLGLGIDVAEVRRLMETDLRGEITESKKMVSK